MDLGEGWLAIAALVVLFHKLALGRPISALHYYVRRNFRSRVNTYEFMKREARTFRPVLKKHGIKLEIRPVRVVKSRRRIISA